MNQLALIAAAGDQAARRFLEFFAATIRNPHTRRAYGCAVTELLTWCDDQGVPSVANLQSLHVAAWVEAPIAYEHRVRWHAARRGGEVLGRRAFIHPDGAGSREYS